MNTNSAKEYVNYYLDQYDKGNQEASFHGLIETPFDIHEILIEAFKNEADESKQSFIIDIISYFPDKRNYDILRTALASNKEKVWKSALDGLVDLSDSQAAVIIHDICQEKKDHEFQVWAKEAISQIQEKNDPDLDVDVIAANETFIIEQKTSKIDQETWICFWICISVPLSVLLSLLFVPLGLLSPILFIAAVSHVIILFVKLFISKRAVKEKINNGLLILAGLLAGPLLLTGLFIYIVNHMIMKLG